MGPSKQPQDLTPSTGFEFRVDCGGFRRASIALAGLPTARAALPRLLPLTPTSTTAGHLGPGGPTPNVGKAALAGRFAEGDPPRS